VKCPALNIQFLGTGTSTGIPMIGCSCAVCSSTDPKDNRLRSSILVSSANTSFVIDTTPDFRYQMLRTNTKKLDAVLYTHPHKDHMAGLDDIRAFNFFSESSMKVYANSLTEEAIRRDFYYAFGDAKYPGVPDINLITIDTTPFSIGDIPIIPIEVFHHKMPVLGFRFGKFTYITDANRIAEEEKEKIKGSEVLVLNALRKEKHISHFTIGEAIELARELAIPKVYFTHISHQLGKDADINKELSAQFQLAHDGLIVCL